MKGIKRHLIIIMTLFAGLLLPAVSCQAVGNEYETALEAAYGDTFKSIYYKKVAGSPLEAEAADGVDTANGHLVLLRTDLFLDGTGGMDLELSRYYDSNEAVIGNPMVETVDELKVDTVYVTYSTQDGETHRIPVNNALLKNHKKALKDMMGSYTKGDDCRQDTVKNTQRTKIISNAEYNVYGIGSGWRYDLPWIETVTIKDQKNNGWGARPAYLHFGSRGTMKIEAVADNVKKQYTIKGLAGYSYSDVQLTDCQREVDGIECAYLLRDKTGFRTYFNRDGVVVLQKDSHNNSITYTYTSQIYLNTITDSVGRKIHFHYEDSDDLKILKSVTVEGKPKEGGVAKKTITYDMEERTYTPLNSDTINGLVLKSVTVDGAKETYGYRTVERIMSTAGYGIASQRAATNESYLLNKVTGEGSITHYEYRAYAAWGPKITEEQDRDVSVAGYYVTREYSEDEQTKKKTDGSKYDLFQKQGDKLVRFCEFEDEKNEIRQYGGEGMPIVAIVSSFNPNKYKTNGKMSDYTYKTSAVNAGTLRLKKNTKKEVDLYIYNSDKLLSEQVNYGKEKEETLYSYDNSGKGSLVVLQTSKTYDSKGSKAVTNNRGYAYDVYRNMISQKRPAAYLAKNAGKEALHTANYTYYGIDKGYPAEDTPYSLCSLVSQEEYTGSGVKERLLGTMADNGIEYVSIEQQRSSNGGGYQTISQTEYTYDEQGNETSETSYPSYSTDGKKESIRNEYTYSSLGQQTKKEVTITSAKYPEQNTTYTAEKSTYDFFGNELSYTDEKGLVTKTTYDPETGEEIESTYAKGTEYESTDKTYTSKDSLKSMSVDGYGRISINIQDGLGNTVTSKNEKEGTWTEYTYEYAGTTGSSTDGEDPEEVDTEEEKEETMQLAEEKTWSFQPKEARFIVNEDGETVANYYIGGKGSAVLSGTKYFYDALGNEVGSAAFTNGTLDAAHCTQWSFTKQEREIGQDGSTVTTSYQKQLDPAAYQSSADPDDYYSQFDDHVLTETITKTITDEAGATLSESSTTKTKGGISQSDTSYTCDDFGKILTQNTITKKYQNKTWLPAYETQISYQYDANGNVVQTETKNRREGDTVWQTQTTKRTYDDRGNVTEQYTPQGVEKGYCTENEYDILGNMVKTKTPQNKKDGTIAYQTITSEYDTSGHLTAKEEQIDDKRTARTEYTYDKLGQLAMVKSMPEKGKAQYVQYLYDREGNKVRQFTGMTSPLTLALEEGDGKDSVAYAGTACHVTISGTKKADTVCETKYEYDAKGNLLSLTDPEGRKETYTYDVNNNLVTTTDKNGNTITNTYDYQNRLIQTTAVDAETGEETVHTYAYNAYGEVAKQDDVSFTYGDVSGQVTKETKELANGKTVTKEYVYDSGDNRTSFTVKKEDTSLLSLTYAYDGAGRLTAVTDDDGEQAVCYSYDEDGSLAEKTVGGAGLTTTYSYDYNNHLTSMQNQTTASGVISSYNCVYLNNGQKAEETEAIKDSKGKTSSKTAAYQYDLLGRLTKESETGSDDISYTYDSNNNRKEQKTGDKTIAYSYNKNDELLRTDTLNAKTEKNAVVIYKNDKNGNQLATVYRKQIENTGAPYLDVDVTLGDNRLNENVVNHYNALNQLTSTLTKDSKVSFTYDADGLRTSKTVNGEETLYIWDNDQIVLELSQSGKVKKRYIRGNDLLYADEGEGTDKTYYAMNPHGDVVQLIDGQGNITKTYEYDSFGNELEEDSKDDNPFRYCGEYYDKETGEVYLRARYYQPGVGRFLTRDTYTGQEDDPLSLHLYVYCGYDGVNGVDPSGHKSYVFTISQFKNEAKGIKKILKKYYGTKSILKVTDTKKKFMKEWNNMKDGKQKIECVVIDSHASPNRLSNKIETKDGTRFDSILDKEDIDSLKYKPVERLILLGCNAGHRDHNNIAVNFMKKIKGPCIASDGTVSSDSSKCTSTSTFDSLNDKSWENFRRGQRKMNYGWIMYTSSKSVKHLNIRSATMNDLLSAK